MCILLIGEIVFLVYNAKEYIWISQAFAAGSKQAVQEDSQPFASSIGNFFQTDAISRASSTMAKCVIARENQQ